MVKVQRAVGVAADGTFDAATEAAVRECQRRHGLVLDGIVGPRTWAALAKVDFGNLTDDEKGKAGHLTGLLDFYDDVIYAEFPKACKLAE